MADRGDVVALVKSLAPRFGPGLKDVVINNLAHAPTTRSRYLNARETGQAIGAGLVP